MSTASLPLIAPYPPDAEAAPSAQKQWTLSKVQESMCKAERTEADKLK